MINLNRIKIPVTHPNVRERSEFSFWDGGKLPHYVILRNLVGKAAAISSMHLLVLNRIRAATV